MESLMLIYVVAMSIFTYINALCFVAFMVEVLDWFMVWNVEQAMLVVLQYVC